jgi:hypothetical protein
MERGHLSYMVNLYLRLIFIAKSPVTHHYRRTCISYHIMSHLINSTLMTISVLVSLFLIRTFWSSRMHRWVGLFLEVSYRQGVGLLWCHWVPRVALSNISFLQTFVLFCTSEFWGSPLNCPDWPPNNCLTWTPNKCLIKNKISLLI